MKQLMALAFLMFSLTSFAANDKQSADCSSMAIAAARAIEGTYGDYEYSYSAKLITELSYTEVSGSMVYLIDVNYGTEGGKYFVTITKNFPQIDCVIANVQYLGNVRSPSP